VPVLHHLAFNALAYEKPLLDPFKFLAFDSGV
jgi:hypothetical protein